MSEKYLLPCRCGHFVAIEKRQAGETVSCECGATLQVPTMSEILALDPVPVEMPETRQIKKWGAKQRLRLFGGLFFLAAIVGLVALLWNKPVSPFQTVDFEQLMQTAKELTPLQTWNHWQGMKAGLDRRVDEKYMAAMARFRLWQVLLLVVGLLGLGLFAASFYEKFHKPINLRT